MSRASLRHIRNHYSRKKFPGEKKYVVIDRQSLKLTDPSFQLSVNLKKNLEWMRQARLLNEAATPKVYTREFDEVVQANDLVDDEELLRLRAYLDNYRDDYKSLSRALTPAIKSALAESDVAPQDTVVSFVIDNSGSMRGQPIVATAIVADFMAAKLKNMGVRTEILGFTTRGWKGGQSREKWLHDGRPPNPGRLCDVRHIVYKDIETSWRVARKNLGLMMREGLLKENVDGEALQWAAARLETVDAKRKVLVYIGDMVQFDDSTLSVNSHGLLQDHFDAAAEKLGRRKDIEICALNTKYDQRVQGALVSFDRWVGFNWLPQAMKDVPPTKLARDLAMLFAPA